MSRSTTLEAARPKISEQLTSVLHSPDASPELSVLDLNPDMLKHAAGLGRLDMGIWLATTIFSYPDSRVAALVKNPMIDAKVISHSATRHGVYNNYCDVAIEPYWSMLLARRQDSRTDFVAMTTRCTYHIPEQEIDAYTRLSADLPWLTSVVVVGKDFTWHRFMIQSGSCESLPSID